jgi:hypothetical protein
LLFFQPPLDHTLIEIVEGRESDREICAGAGRNRVDSASRNLAKSRQLGNQILPHWCANSALFGHAPPCTHFVTTVLKEVRPT